MLNSTIASHIAKIGRYENHFEKENTATTKSKTNMHNKTYWLEAPTFWTDSYCVIAQKTTSLMALKLIKPKKLEIAVALKKTSKATPLASINIIKIND